MTRFVTTAQGQPEAKATDLVAYLTGPWAPTAASTSQVRAIARLFQFDATMKALADGEPEVDAQELADVATEELSKADPGTMGARALQALINWMLVGAGRVQEIRSI